MEHKVIAIPRTTTGHELFRVEMDIAPRAAPKRWFAIKMNGWLFDDGPFYSATAHQDQSADMFGYGCWPCDHTTLFKAKRLKR